MNVRSVTLSIEIKSGQKNAKRGAASIKAATKRLFNMLLKGVG
jgi:hypothetical protein